MPWLIKKSVENNPLMLMPVDVWTRLGQFSENAYSLAELHPKIEEAICAATESLTQEQVKMLYLLISLDWLRQKKIFIDTNGHPPITIPSLPSLPTGHTGSIDRIVELIIKTPNLKKQFGATAKEMNVADDHKRYVLSLIICGAFFSPIAFGLYKLFVDRKLNSGFGSALLLCVGDIFGAALMAMFVGETRSLVMDFIKLLIVDNHSSLKNHDGTKKIPLKTAQYTNLRAAFFQLAAITTPKNAEDALSKRAMSGIA